MTLLKVLHYIYVFIIKVTSIVFSYKGKYNHHAGKMVSVSYIIQLMSIHNEDEM